MTGCCEHNLDSSGYTGHQEFIEELSDYHFLKKGVFSVELVSLEIMEFTLKIKT